MKKKNNNTSQRVHVTNQDVTCASPLLVTCFPSSLFFPLASQQKKKNKQATKPRSHEATKQRSNGCKI